MVVNTQLARLGAIRRFFAWLCRSGAIPANPACDLDLPRKQAQHLPKCLDDDEIRRLLALPDTADPCGLRDRTILEVFHATGVRRTEMTSLDHGDFDPPARTLLVRKGKAGKSRPLPLGERAAWWLEKYLAEIHARCHPHGRMPVPDENLGELLVHADAEDKDNAANAPDEKLSSSLPAADPLSGEPAMTAVLTAPAAITDPVLSSGRERGKSPGPDDSDPGFGPFPTPNRPRPPRPRNPRNSWPPTVCGGSSHAPKASV